MCCLLYPAPVPTVYSLPMAPTKVAADGGRKSGATETPKKIMEAIKAATGASEEEIKLTLAECNFDVNEATSRLIDSEWERWMQMAGKRHNPVVRPR